MRKVSQRISNDRNLVKILRIFWKCENNVGFISVHHLLMKSFSDIVCMILTPLFVHEHEWASVFKYYNRISSPQLLSQLNRQGIESDSNQESEVGQTSPSYLLPSMLFWVWLTWVSWILGLFSSLRMPMVHRPHLRPSGDKVCPTTVAKRIK